MAARAKPGSRMAVGARRRQPAAWLRARRGLAAGGLLTFCWLGAAAAEPASLVLTSPSFEHGGAIPARHTCEGVDLSPALRWSGVPAGARSLVLIVDDPDAPDPAAPQRTWVHWVLYDLPAAATELPEGVVAKDLPAGARVGRNDWKRAGYGGPCPPVGRHRYFHQLYALDISLGDLGSPTKADIQKAMAGHVVARGELVGTYEKKGSHAKPGDVRP